MQNTKTVSFPHPSASYQDHVLIIPRKVARNVFCLSPDDFIDIINMAAEVRKDDNRDYVLLINGGSRQDVMQAHFHLFTGNFAAHKGCAKENGQAFYHPDKDFWIQLTSRLHDLIKECGVSDNAFSIFIQFEKNSLPIVFFV